jgi:fluoride exporter
VEAPPRYASEEVLELIRKNTDSKDDPENRLSTQRSLNLQRYLFIAIGGALGSVARFWIGTTVAGRMGTRFPFGTLVINITACLIIGLSVEILNRHTDLNPSWRFLIPIGFVGAYSTFSTYEWEIYSNLMQGAFWIAILYLTVSLVAGLIAVAAGVSLAKLIF